MHDSFNTAFHAGEVLVTEARVKCCGSQGFGMVIGEDPVDDARRFRRTENGITLVTQQMIEKLS